jgi:hypothetical protein
MLALFISEVLDQIADKLSGILGELFLSHDAGV